MVDALPASSRLFFADRLVASSPAFKEELIEIQRCRRCLPGLFRDGLMATIQAGRPGAFTASPGAAADSYLGGPRSLPMLHDGCFFVSALPAAPPASPRRFSL